MKKSNFFFLMAAAFMAFQSCNSNSGKTDSTNQAEQINSQQDSVNSDVSDFMVKAADGGMTEVEMGKLAQQNAKSPRVKSFGAMMVKDHTKANDELKPLATKKSVTIPAVMSNEHQMHYDELKKLSGAEFDKKYMDMMVKDHNEDISLFQDAADKSPDAEVKAFASKTLPVLKMHLDSAKAVNDGLK